jgi:hypothetical protein
MLVKKYPCTQRELYAVCLSGWKNCLENIKNFYIMRPIYTEEYVESRLKEIAKVNDLPGRSKRSAKQDVARIELKEKLEECHGAWKKLKTTLPAIFPENRLEACYKDMGQEFYADSKQFKWEACTGLMDAALSFSRQNAALLEASPLLGPNHLNELGTLTGDLHAALAKYLDKRKEYSKGADDKIKACNELHKELTFMFSDAKIIFRNNPTLLNDFRFDTLLDFVSGHGSAGIKGKISNGQVAIDQIPDLLLTLVENGDEAYIAEDGNYRFSQLAAGVYTINVTAKGYKEQNIPGITVNPGSYTTNHITLEVEGAGEL